MRTAESVLLMCWPPAPEAQVGGIDLDFDGFVHFGIDEHAGERGVAAVAGVERRFAHQAMHAGLGAQVAVGIVAGNLERCALDARDIAVGLFQHFDLKTFAFAIAQIHAQQHRCPVLRFGAAGAGLDVDEAVVRIHRVGKHAAEFHRRDALLDILDVGGSAVQALVIVFRLRHFEQLARIAEVLLDLREAEHDAFQHLAFAPQVLCALGVLPDGGIFGEFGYFGQALLLGIEVKDTSAILRCAMPSLAVGWRGYLTVRLP
jgi:hypothetical protein